MTTDHAITFARAGLGGYDVLLDGEVIGYVFKWERRYNLNRVYVSRGWRAKTADGQNLFGANGTTANTRREAARALANERERQANG